MRGKRQPKKALQTVPINTRYQSGMFSLRSSRKETGGSDSFSFRFRCLLLRRERRFLVDGSSSSSSSASSSSNLTIFSNLKKRENRESEKLLFYIYNSTASEIPSTLDSVLGFHGAWLSKLSIHLRRARGGVCVPCSRVRNAKCRQKVLNDMKFLVEWTCKKYKRQLLSSSVKGKMLYCWLVTL